MAGVYTYLFADLRTNAILGEFELSGVSFGLQLNGAGSFLGKLKLGDPKVAKKDPIGCTQPSRTALYVDRDGALVWGGIIWTRRYNSQTKELELAGNEFWSYFRARLIRADSVSTAVDQLAIVRSRINAAQAVPGGNIGVTVGTELTTDNGGVQRLRDRTVYAYEGKPVAKDVEELSALQNGFDFAIDVFYDNNGNPAKALHLGYPRRGAYQSATGWLFEYPGNIVDYIYPEDGTAQANSVFDIGRGLGATMVTSTASRPDLIDAGYPLLEKSYIYADVSVQATIDAHAQADVAARAFPVTLPVVSVRADQDPVLGSYIQGDDARFRINDERFPDGKFDATKAYFTGYPSNDGLDHTLDTYGRIIAMQVTPPDAAQHTAEKVLLTLGAST